MADSKSYPGKLQKRKTPKPKVKSRKPPWMDDDDKKSPTGKLRKKTK